MHRHQDGGWGGCIGAAMRQTLRVVQTVDSLLLESPHQYTTRCFNLLWQRGSHAFSAILVNVMRNPQHAYNAHLDHVSKTMNQIV